MNTGELLVGNGFIPFVVLVVAWLMPSLTLPTLPFGVRVPAARTGAAVIARERRRYRWRIGVSGLVVVAAGVVVSSARIMTPPGVVVLLVLLAGLVSYTMARRSIIVVKESERWYEGLRQAVVADTSLRTEPTRFPWLWALPAVLVVAATAVLGIVRYPSLPSRIPVHFGASGHADRFAARTVGTVFLPVFVQFAVTVFIVVLAWFSFRSRPELDPAHPADSARRHRRYSVRLVAAVILLAAFADLSVLAASWQTWNPGGRVSPVAVYVPMGVGLIAVLAVAIRGGQAGARLPTSDDGPQEDTGMVHRDDDRYWRGGLLYVNRADPAVFVPKRFGIGWTVNFGNPRGLLLIAGLLAVAVVVPLVAH
jgi:uncharacterized membrane protein